MATTTKKYISLEKLGLYDEKIKKVISDGDADSLAQAKAYANGLADNYEPAGSVATAQTALQKNIDAVETKADTAQAAADKAQKEVDALEVLVGTLPEGTTAKDVVDYVDIKTAGLKTETETAVDGLQTQITSAQNAIDAIEADYLKAADKTELANAIASEATTARAAEKANADAIDAIEADYLKAADKTELQGNIDTNADAIAAIKEDVDAFFKDADMTASAKDTLKELQEYIASDETGAASMAASIKANADAIDALEGRMDTAEGDIDAVEGRMTTAETNIANLQAKFGTGEGTVSDMIADAVAVETSARETAIAEVQEDADKGIADAAVALKAAQDASAHADELNGAMDTRVKTLETASATHALASDVTALAGRVTTAEGEIDTLQTEMDTVEALAAANDAAIKALQTASATHALQSDLEAVSGRVGVLETWHNNFTEASEEEINALFQ